MTSMIFIAVLLVLVIAIISIALFFGARRSTSSRSSPSPSLLPEDMAAPPQPPLNTSASLTSPYSMPGNALSQQSTYDSGYSSFSDKGANQSTRSTHFDESLPGQRYAQSYPAASAYTHPRHELSQHATAKSSQNNLAFYELEQTYERGMQVIYDPSLDATLLVLTNVVMKTPAEVDLAFQVCTRKIQAVLRSRGKQRAALLVDIAGLVIGPDATTVWGQSLKACWDAVCSVAGKDQYLAAHYNSKASQPSQEQLQAKIRRIQIMTSAVLNDFQSNIFDTREEAVAFLQRMRELKAL